MKIKGEIIIFKHQYIALFILLFSTFLFGRTENYLRSTSMHNNSLNLSFKYNVKSVSIMTIKGHGIIKYVYDIKGGSLPLNKNISHYKHKGIKAFRIGQYTKKTLRVVLESFVPIESRKYKIEGKKVIISLPLVPKEKKKKVLVKTKKKKNKHKVKTKVRTKKKYSRGRSYKGLYRGKSSNKKIAYRASRRYKTIIIDPGHGGKDIGASSGRVIEKNITLRVSRKLKKVLQKMGYRVYMTRNSDRFLTLRQRTAYANRKKGTLFISIHANAAPEKKPKVNYQGIEVFYVNPINFKRMKRRSKYRGQKYCSRKSYKRMMSRSKISKSNRLARKIKSNILSHVKRKYRIYDKGIKRNDFWVLLATKMPSVLIETGYLTHKNEVQRLTNGRYQDRLVEGIAHGVNAYFR